ncbi:hypothetical protein [Reyranella soli]|uniref:hypothetical protein n=1 Tax=Reyranella soli TaxID=1230389 RepID=UPI0011BFB7DB|nr:hypothetical protein [Reyranella soli]
MVDFLAGLDAAGARPYAKLVSLERLVTTFSEDSVVALANLVRQRERESEHRRIGPAHSGVPRMARRTPLDRFRHY